MDRKNARRWVPCLAALLVLLGASSAQARQYLKPPLGSVFTPRKLFKPDKDELDGVVITANPKVYLYPDFDLSAEPKLLVVGLPGWGGRSENFIWTLVNGLKGSGLTSRLVVVSVQDMVTGGPRYQGQGDRAHANVYQLKEQLIEGMKRLLVRLSVEFGRSEVFLMGYSSGAVTAPRLAVRMARRMGKPIYRVAGSIALGTGSAVRASSLRAQKQRTLFVVVPEKRPEDEKPLRDDQYNRKNALRSIARLEQNKAEAWLRTVESARRHVDWHWGLLSQCRYFRTNRIDPGRGYWPNYWMANPETYAYIVPFIKGQTPPEKAEGIPPQKCPY